MRAAMFSEHGGVENISIGDFPDPVCGADDAVIKVNAVSLNGFDPMILGGTTGLKTPMPMVPGGDYAGEIVELGANVGDGWALGDRVCPHPFVLGEGMTGETRLGAAAEFARIPASQLIRTPDGVSDDQAAALPIAYGTAYRMMLTRGRVKAGETVLILGATGGVGTGCLQLAKSAGATVIVTGSAAWKLDRLRDLAADHVIDTSSEDIVAACHAIAGKPRMGFAGGGGGVDVIINYIGGDTWAQSLRCLRPDGRMLTCGATAGYAPPTDIRYIWTYEQNIIGSNGWTGEEQQEVLEMVGRDELTPVIHAVRPLDQIAPSIQELIDRAIVGKTIIRPNE
ncbi:MAG: zinc-binding dehydrogenase [Alphaproteobacteria bacterium]|nr:zinc-binding dehydrogenase [Alphaproteobacteria bacterium]